MRLYVARHGYAGDDDDPARELTDEGAGIVRALGAWMKDKGEIPDTIFASPKTRTQQTADILRSTLGVKRAVVTEYALRPGGMPTPTFPAAVKKVAADKSLGRVILVSHHDSIEAGLRFLNALDASDVDPIAMSEMRVLRVNRKDATWKEKYRVVPDRDLGLTDYF